MTRTATAKQADIERAMRTHSMKLAYRIDEAAAAIGVHRATLYRLIDAGKITARGSGRATFIMADDLRRYVESLPALPSKKAAQS